MMGKIFFHFLKILLFLIAISLTACSSLKAPAFPEELFKQQAPGDTEKKCFIEMGSVKVKVPQVTPTGGPLFSSTNPPPTPVVVMEGNMTSGCGQLQIKINRPNLDNQIVIELAAEYRGGAKDGMTPFFISMPINDLWQANFSIWIFSKQWATFTLP